MKFNDQNKYLVLQPTIDKFIYFGGIEFWSFPNDEFCEDILCYQKILLFLALVEII